MDPIPMEDLIKWNIEWKDTHSKNLSILSGTSGITSTISSSTLIWMILRSHQGLSTTQHRLLLGLCICDIMSSLSYSTFNAAVPSEMNYLVWNARGNDASCTAQGFFVSLGVFCGLYYNTALNLYFLAVIKYEKSDECIRTKIEPFLHAVPIILSFAYSISLLLMKHNNGSGFDGTMTSCNDPFYYPPHCEGYDVGETRPGFDIPCGRGLEGAMAIAVSCVMLMFIPAIIMFISLGIIYRVVQTQEKKLARYASFRTNLQQSILRRNTQTPQEDSKNRNRPRLLESMRRTLSRSWTSSLASSSMNTTASSLSIRSNDTRSKSRAVMHKAFGYSFAWFLSYGAFVVVVVIFVAGSQSPTAFGYIYAIFLPLQGFFNLTIYMLPKVVYAKKQGRGENISIYQAIRKAFWSKGTAHPTRSRRNGRRTRRGGWSNLRGGGDDRSCSQSRPHQRPLRSSANNDMYDHTANSSATRHLSSSIQCLRGSRKERQEEEEKCEIQARPNMSLSHKKKRQSLVTFAPNLAVPNATYDNDYGNDGNDFDDVMNPKMSNLNRGGETEDVDSSKNLQSHGVDGDDNVKNNQETMKVGNDYDEETCEIQAPHNTMLSHKKRESFLTCSPNIVPTRTVMVDDDDMNTPREVSSGQDDKNDKNWDNTDRSSNSS